MVPFLCLFAALAVFRIYDSLRSARWPVAAGQLLLLVGLALAVNFPIGKIDVKSWEGAAYAAYGSYLLENDKTAEALQEVDLSATSQCNDAWQVYTLYYQDFVQVLQ